MAQEVAECRDPSRTRQDRGQSGRFYVAAVDYAEKHDDTVGVVVHLEGDLVIVDRMDVVRPQPNRTTPVAWVEDWMRRIAAGFGPVRFVLDEFNLVSVIQKWEHQLDIVRFDFAGGRGNHALAANLRTLILSRRVRWYPGCGSIAQSSALGTASAAEAECDVSSPSGRDDLETELASVITRETSLGRWRLDHRRDQHDDRVFALGAACLHAAELPVEPEWMQVITPAHSGFSW